MIKNLLNIASGFFAFILVLVFLKSRLPYQQAVVVSLFVWMLIWWSRQVVHYAVTALLPIIVLPLLEVVNLKEATQQYANPVIYLFFGGFLLALSVEKWGIHKRLALWLLKYFNRNLTTVYIAVALSTYVLSMWISNTATAIMMIPICTALMAVIGAEKSISPRSVEKMYLLVAFAANIGGIATLIGTPPNLVFSGFYYEKFNTPITFLSWFAVGFPISLIFLMILIIVLRPSEVGAFSGDVRHQIMNEYRRLPPLTTAQRRVLMIFTCVAVLWFAAPFLKLSFLNDTSVAVAGGLTLFLVSTGEDNDKKLLEWDDTKDLSWGILLLFGAGLTMASMFEKTGLATEMSFFFQSHFSSEIVLAVAVVAFTVFATEVMSNVALTGLMMPIIAGITMGNDQAFYFTGMSVAMASSCAFMLPIATPPNAVVFSTGQIQMHSMMKKGLLLNAISITLFTLLLTYTLAS